MPEDLLGQASAHPASPSTSEGPKAAHPRPARPKSEGPGSARPEPANPKPAHPEPEQPGSARPVPQWSAEGTNRAAGAFLDGFFAQLKALGVRDVVASPGSRSTPLTMKAYEHFGDVVLDVDERGAGFFALGLAKASGRPVAVTATSGTAIGNWMPAVLEAQSSHVPVLFVSSDRPARLQGVGAPQTCDQVELFGSHVRLFRQMPDPNILAAEAGFEPAGELPAELVGKLARAGAEAARDAVFAALGIAGGENGTLRNPDPGKIEHGGQSPLFISGGAIAGPVHFNFPFDEPLKPAPRLALADDALGQEPGRAASLAAHAPLFADADSQGAVPEGEAETSGAADAEKAGLHSAAREAAQALAGKRTLIIAGEGAAQTPAEAAAIFEAAEALHLPILADPLSGLRRPEGTTVIANYDSLCTRGAQPPIEGVIRLGRWPVSKRLALAVGAARPVHISVDRHEPLDFTGTCTLAVRANPAVFLRALRRQLAAPASEATPTPAGSITSETQIDYLRQWTAADRAAEARIAAVRTEADPDFEGTYVRALLDEAPEGSLLVVANSMAIRALDTFMFRHNLRVLANRGLNGIDGTTSTALGAALAHARAATREEKRPASPPAVTQSEPPQQGLAMKPDGGPGATASPASQLPPSVAASPATTYLVGDLTLLHDLNALALAPELARHGHAAPLVIVCLNNAGGAIFDMLPQRAPDPYFERLFLTPQHLDLRAAAATFSLPYAAPATPEAFAAAYRKALETPGITLIDVALPLAGIPERYRRYW